MAHSLSANKRVRQSAKRRLRNRDRKKTIKTHVKNVLTLVEKKDAAGAKAALTAAIKTLDRNANQGTLHPNTAARRKSRLARKLNALQAASS